MKYKDVAEKYDVRVNTIKSDTNGTEKVYTEKKTGVPIGNKNAWAI